MIVERLDPLTYVVQVDSGVFWHRHVDHLRVAPDGLSKQNDTVHQILHYNQIHLANLISFQLSIQNSQQLSNRIPSNVLLKDTILKD